MSGKFRMKRTARGVENTYRYILNKYYIYIDRLSRRIICCISFMEFVLAADDSQAHAFHILLLREVEKADEKPSDQICLL